MDLRAMLKAIKVGELVPPQLKNDGDFADNTYFDTLGLSSVLFLIHAGTVDAAIGSTAEGTAVKVEECDTTDGTYSDVTDAELADAIAADEDNSFFGIHVDLAKSHKRYMQLNAPHAGSGTTGCNMSAIAIGFPSDQMPKSASEMGLTELIEA
ncbi:MAG TPA: hypothetical protein HPP51_00790 [Planctomycetes bacterium]|nr:hypothetical protein [Planctomycetota bacterium]